MNINIRRLTFAARRLHTRIEPSYDVLTGMTVIDARQARDLRAAVTRTSFSSIDANAVHRLLGRGHEPVALTGAQLLQLTGALNRLADAADRAHRISRGRYSGPLSPSEAARLMRRGF